MNDRPPDLDGREALRRLERRIGRLRRDGEPLELARLELERVEVLLELGEEELALPQLDLTLERLQPLAGSQPAVLARAYARRVRLCLGDDPTRAAVGLEDVDRALELLRGLDATPELAALQAELKRQQGQLLVALEDERALEALRVAVEEARSLEGPEGPTLLAHALRELASAHAAAEDMDSALLELEAAAEALRQAPQAPRSEHALLRSTRAELLANAGRLEEALEELAEAPDEDWVLVQRAATLDLAERFDEARRTAATLVARLRERLDDEDLEACQQLGEVLLLQARRSPEDERGPLAAEVLQLLAGFSYLPARSRRLLAHALELLASAGEEEEAHHALERRGHLLEELIREEGEERDLIELIRTWMLDGDALLRQGDPWNARRRYQVAIRELEELPPEHPAVVGILALAYNAMAQALGTCGSWLAAAAFTDEAVGAISPNTSLPGLAELGEVFLFRAICRINVGAPEEAVEGLGEDVTRLVEAIQRADAGTVPASLVEVTINAAVLQAEVLVDHLDLVDEAAHTYDQALALCRVAKVRSEVQAAILGAKASMLTERDRPQDALPLLEESVELFQNGSQSGSGDLAFALVNLASTLNRMGAPRDALGKIQEAQGLLQRARGEGLDPARRQVIRSFLFHQRGEALLGVGHPLLAADEFTRAIDISRDLLDEDGDPRLEARQRLPLSLLRRARCWLLAGDHPREASSDLREARKRYAVLFEDEGRPEHGRRLREVEVLERELDGDRSDVRAI